jgi:hypothetical protein
MNTEQGISNFEGRSVYVAERFNLRYSLLDIQYSPPLSVFHCQSFLKLKIMETDTIYTTQNTVQLNANNTKQQDTNTTKNSPKRQHERTIRGKSKAHRAHQDRLTSLADRLMN